jgi:hypothetical protein
MRYPSEIKSAQARDTLAQLQASLVHTQQLIDASIQQMQEIQELLSRIGQMRDLMRDSELLWLGTGDRANAPAKQKEPRP